MSAYLLFSQNKKIFRYINFRHTTNSVFLSRLVMFLLVSEPKWKTTKKKKRKHKMLFSWFTILFMARFMDLWWNKRQISEIKYWNIFSVVVSIHYVTWSIVTPQKTDRILITVKRVLLFSNQKKLQFDKGYYKGEGKMVLPASDKPLGEEERKKSTSILAKRNQE